MTGSPFDANDEAAERAFQRTLLESARDDGLPAGALEAAWQRFSLASATLSLGLTEGGEHGSRFGRKLESQRVAWRWGALGALGGGTLVAAWFGLVTKESAPALVGATASAPAPSAVSAAVAGISTQAAARAPREEAPREDAHRQRRALPNAAGRSTPPLPPQARIPPVLPDSSLAEEIALLDAARTAIAAGAFDDALRLVEQHRRQHPRGMLRRDAEVLAIEALAERGDRPEATQRARQFLDSFPSDPHATRLRELTASPSTTSRSE